MRSTRLVVNISIIVTMILSAHLVSAQNYPTKTVRIVDTLHGSRSKAVLMRNHGVFTIGATAKAAVKAAVMCEDVARTVHIARQLGEVLMIAESDVDALYERYQNAYGQARP